MAASAGSVARSGRTTDAAAVARQYFITFSLCLVGLNVFTFLYHLTNAAMFNSIGNAIGLGLIGYSLRPIVRGPREAVGGRTFLLFSTVAVLLSLIANMRTASFTDALKYLSIYVFYAAGRACGGEITRLEVRCTYVLAALPLTFLAVGTSRVFEGESFFTEIFAYLPNDNTAVLYFSALLFAVARYYGDRVILVQVVNTVLMARMGALFATVAAVGLWIAFPVRRQTVIGIGLAVVLGFIAFEFGAFERAVSTLDNLTMVFGFDPGSVSSMSYGELVRLTGSTDLSAFFRLIHWSNIWDIYSHGGIGTVLFGYGAGRTPLLTYAQLVPHNDYLRVLAEYGPFNLVIFVGFLLHIRSRLATGATKVLFVVLCIYFLSENLLDNFTSMAIYFAFAGRFIAVSSQQAVPPASTRRRGAHGLALQKS